MEFHVFDWPSLVFDTIWFVLVMIPVGFLVNHFRSTAKSTKGRYLLKSFVILGTIMAGLMVWILFWLFVSVSKPTTDSEYGKDSYVHYGS